jgi:hypothetical protein
MHFDPLTTEKLRKKFNNNFDLCEFSIQAARNMILNHQQISLSEVLRLIQQQPDAVQP